MALMDAIQGGLLAFAATSLGALMVLFFKKIDPKTHSILMAFSAGVMAFSVWEMSSEALLEIDGVVFGLFFVAGMALLLALERFLPHAHPKVQKGNVVLPAKKCAMIAGAIALHNIPEGFAIGAAFAGSPFLGWTITSAIAIQDIPEGLMISAPLTCLGMKKNEGILYGMLSGAAEFFAAIVGFLFLNLFAPTIPFALAFSAGAMFLVIFVEVLPDAVRSGHGKPAAIFFFAGIAIASIIASLLRI